MMVTVRNYYNFEINLADLKNILLISFVHCRNLTNQIYPALATFFYNMLTQDQHEYVCSTLCIVPYVTGKLSCNHHFSEGKQFALHLIMFACMWACLCVR